MMRALELAQPALDECLWRETPIRFTVERDGRVTHAAPTERSDEQLNECVARAFQDVRVEPAYSWLTIIVRVRSRITRVIPIAELRASTATQVDAESGEETDRTALDGQ